MPKELEKCVSAVKDKEHAYAICAKSTGWVRSKSGWRNTKTGATYESKMINSFLDSVIKG